MPFYYNSANPPNAFVRFYRHIYRPLGFSKGYNFPLWVIFGGAIFGFVWSRLMYLASVGGTYATAKAATGDWYYQQRGHYHVALVMHLAVVIPAGILLPLQFVPKIRHKLILFHRLNGYLLILLLLLAAASGLMLARHTLGGNMDTQAYVGLLAIMSTVGVVLAYINIKRLQIDQHRAWMLRTWFYVGSIISLRLIQLAATKILTQLGDFYEPMSCVVIDSISKFYGIPPAATRYPACAADPNAWVAVLATAKPVGVRGPPPLEQAGAAAAWTFGTCGFLALIIHAVGIEVYLKFTPAEAERLRQVSYERQLGRFKHPGSAGVLMIDRWGDSEPFTAKEETNSTKPGDDLELR